MTSRLGPVHLSVADLARSTTYYRDVLGLELDARPDLLVLHEQPGARPAGATAGLFHFALLVPSREELARSLARLIAAGARLAGASDHLVSEALYLRDPDGHGIEIYRDRPREEWTRTPDGGVEMASLPLDLQDLLGEAGERPGSDPFLSHATVMGHVHLQVGDVDAAAAFAEDVLGLRTQAQLGDQAQFLSWDGYHHHVGMNSWAGRGIPPAPPDTARLLRWTARVSRAELDAIRAGVGIADDGATLELIEPTSGVTVALSVA